jgi:hypothetical protein
MFFWFSLQLLSGTFVILGRSERDLIKNFHWSSCKVKKYPNVKLHENTSSGSRVVPCGLWTDGWTDGQTDRLTNITKLIVTFRNFRNALKNGVIQRNCVVYSYIKKTRTESVVANLHFRKLISVVFTINVHENLCYDSVVLYLVLWSRMQ